MTAKITNYQEVLNFLYTKIPRAAFTMFPGKYGLERAQYIMGLLDNPQDKIKVIHLAGTSGKGSTATFISNLLISQGQKVGLHISPFLIDIRERMQINNELISEKKFVHYFNETKFIFDAVEKAGYGEITYFEALTAMEFYLFWKEKVDYAVIETGMGGWYDATNTVHSPNKLCVITKIGLDHTHILGKTMSEIALHKAMIMQKGNTAFSISQEQKVEKVFKKIAQKQGAELFFVKQGKEINNISVSEKGTQFNFSSGHLKLDNLSVSLIGDYQAENAGLALRAVYHLSQRDGFKLNTENIRKAVAETQFLGRFQIIPYKNKKMILDGAHNPQKMRAFIKNLKMVFPKQKFEFIVAIKKGKDTAQMLKQIIPLASKIYLGSFLIGKQDLVHISQERNEVKELLIKQGFHKTFNLGTSKKDLEDVMKKNTNNIVITGSLYYLASLYSLLPERLQTPTHPKV